MGFAEKAQGLRVLSVLAEDLGAVLSFCNRCEGVCLHEWTTQEAETHREGKEACGTPTVAQHSLDISNLVKNVSTL